MTRVQTRQAEGMLHLTFDDGLSASYPFIWLRDNDPSGFHPDTRERTFELISVPIDIAPVELHAEDDALVVRWPDTSAPSRFGLEWLRARRPGMRATDPADLPQPSWRADAGAGAVPRVSARAILDSDAASLDWLVATQTHGLSIVEGLEDRLDAGTEVARRIGHLRETNFGLTFEVQSKPDPNNLAYTAVALPLHTDLTNQELPPGFQFLHCLANEATGGGSLFCDGYAIAEDLRRQDAEAFDLLSTVSIPFRFHDATTDIRSRKRVIVTDEDGSVREICFNAHIAETPDLEPELMQRYYRAYRLFMEMSRSPDYVISLRLEAGEMVVFDNRRVLHGREAFDPSTGFRHLHGCYVDRGEFESRIRVLSRVADGSPQS